MLASVRDRAVAAVAADIFFAAGEQVDGELAVVAAQAALRIFHFVREGFQRFGAQQCGVCLMCAPCFFHTVQRCAVSAHQTGNIGTDDLGFHLLFKRAQNGFIVERAALHDDFAAQLLGAGSADNLVQRVFYHTDGKAGGDVLNGSAVLLRLLDGRVHKHRAAAAQIDGAVGKQSKLGKLGHGFAHGLGKCLQKAAAAGGTRFI